MLVERITDGKLFAAKFLHKDTQKDLDLREKMYFKLKEEVTATMLMKGNNNAVRIEDCFEDDYEWKLILILEYCSSKFPFLLTQFV